MAFPDTCVENTPDGWVRDTPRNHEEPMLGCYQISAAFLVSSFISSKNVIYTYIRFTVIQQQAVKWIHPQYIKRQQYIGLYCKNTKYCHYSTTDSTEYPTLPSV